MAEKNVYENPANTKGDEGLRKQNPKSQAGSSGQRGENIYVKEGAKEDKKKFVRRENKTPMVITNREPGVIRYIKKTKGSGSQLTRAPNGIQTKQEEQLEKKRMQRERKYESKTQKRESKDQKERQERESKKAFGRFSIETGWKVILSFLVYAFLVCVAVCVLIIFVYTWRTAPSREKERRITEATRSMIQDTYKSMKLRMDDLEIKVEKETKRISGSLKNHTEELEKDMSAIQDKTLKGLDRAVDHLKDHAKEQKKILDFQFEIYNDTAKLGHHEETIKTLSRIDNEILKLFKRQDDTVGKLISVVRGRMASAFRAHGNILSSAVDDVQMIVNDGFSEKDAELNKALSGLRENTEGDLVELLRTVSGSLEYEARKLMRTIGENSDDLQSDIQITKDDIAKQIDSQESTLREFLHRAISDINNYTKVAEENNMKYIDKKIKEYEVEFLAGMGTLPTLSNTMKGIGQAFKNGINAKLTNASEDFQVFDEMVDNAKRRIKNSKGGIKNWYSTYLIPFKYTKKLASKEQKPNTCKQVRYIKAVARNLESDGAVYEVHFPNFKAPLKVFCSEKNEGWMVIMRLEEKTAIFNAPYEDYLEEMGNIEHGNYWMGLTAMHKITSHQTYKLRIEVTLDDDTTNVQIFDLFKVGTPECQFKLTIGERIAGESDKEIPNAKFKCHDGRVFSTYDRGSEKSCAVTGGGGWWYYSKQTIVCQTFKLTGTYYKDAASRSGNKDGIIIGKAEDFYKRAEMSIKHYYTDVLPKSQ